MDGILVVDKPSGWTSHDVVARMRRLTKIKRIGHTGTLDPMATGVLVLCLGQATRLVEYLTGHDKRYQATIRLGVETDTHDADGRLTARQPVDVSEVALRSALAAFVGEIEQVPPMFSALKRDGKKLVDLARKGVEVARAPRRITIHSIDLLAFDSPDATIDVHCSGGTYIRSLAHDLGRKLGCGAHLAVLRRTAVGDFTLDQAISLETFEAAVVDGSWFTLLRPLDAALAWLPSIRLNDDEAARARQGMSLTHRNEIANDLVRAYDPTGRLVGLMKFDPVRRELKPNKILSLDT